MADTLLLEPKALADQPFVEEDTMHNPAASDRWRQRIDELEGQVAGLQQENRALRHTEERFRALFEQAADYILILEPTADGIPVIVDLNEAACQIHGYTRAELLGQPISFLDNTTTQKNIPERARQLLAGASQTFEAEHTRKDGATITVEVTAQPIVVNGKRYIYAIERDITTRKRNEMVLRNYERIIATSREHMSLVDRHYVYQAVNDAYLTAHKHRREEIVGHSVAEMLGQETFDRLVKEKLDRCLAGEEVRYQGWFQFAGLDRVFMDVAYYPLVEADGSVSGVVVNSRNLTAQHEAEEALRLANERLEARVAERTAELLLVNAHLEQEVAERRRSEERLRIIFQTTPDLVAITRLADGLLLEVNGGFNDITGYSRSEAIGHTTLELHLWHNPEERLKMIQLFTQQGLVKNFELELQRRDGSVTTVLLSARCIDFEGERHLLSVVRDIGDWKAVRARLHLLSNAVEQTGEGIGIAGLNGAILFTNQAFAAMHGYAVAEIVGQQIAMLHTAEQMPVVEATLRQTLQTGEFSGEVMHARRDGSTFPGLMHVSLLRDEAGAPIAIIGTLRDFTAQRVMEDELRQARKAAEAASLAKSAFLANMSHEVRTPLNAIIGFADLLKDGMAGPVTSTQQEYLDEIWQGGQRLLGLITDILDLSLLEVEETETAREVIDLDLLLTESLESCREKARLRQISLQLAIAPAIGTIASDERVLRKVVARLLENALKFTPPGGSVGLAVDKANGEMRVSVWDTGIGISEEQMARLFLPFQQGDSSINKSYQGLGLGLVLCKRFLELLGGRIEVESTQQVGSRFTFYLPD